MRRPDKPHDISAGAELLSRAGEFRTALHGWFDACRRKLPWRETPSLYGTVVSEFMLQQTQVATVVPYYERWLERWPDFAALARAAEADVVHAWEGLGYYSRVRNLRRLAIALAAMPAPPATAAEWCAFPGVGPYTAAAIASIALGELVAVTDGNVVRVLSRLTADKRRFAGGSEAVKAIAPLAQALLGADSPSRHNQAMMELGALVCHRNNPRCAQCPVAFLCAATQTDPEQFPHIARRTTLHIALQRLWIVREGRLLLQRHAAHAKRLSSLHELPLRKTFPHAKLGPVLARKKRAISNQQLTETIRLCPWTPALDAAISATEDLLWVPLAQLDTVTLSGPHRKWITEILAQPPR